MKLFQVIFGKVVMIGVCEVVNLGPEYVECADKNCCYKSDEYEICKLYMDLIARTF